MEIKTQRDRILGLLVQSRGGWVSWPEITALAAQYGTRILELRRLGFRIENRTQTVAGSRHSWFRLCPERTIPRPCERPAVPDKWPQRSQNKSNQPTSASA